MQRASGFELARSSHNRHRPADTNQRGPALDGHRGPGLGIVRVRARVDAAFQEEGAASARPVAGLDGGGPARRGLIRYGPRVEMNISKADRRRADADRDGARSILEARAGGDAHCKGFDGELRLDICASAGSREMHSRDPEGRNAFPVDK